MIRRLYLMKSQIRDHIGWPGDLVVFSGPAGEDPFEKVRVIDSLE